MTRRETDHENLSFTVLGGGGRRLPQLVPASWRRREGAGHGQNAKSQEAFQQVRDWPGQSSGSGTASARLARSKAREAIRQVRDGHGQKAQEAIRQVRDGHDHGHGLLWRQQKQLQERPAKLGGPRALRFRIPVTRPPSGSRLGSPGRRAGGRRMPPRTRDAGAAARPAAGRGGRRDRTRRRR